MTCTGCAQCYDFSGVTSPSLTNEILFHLVPSIRPRASIGCSSVVGEEVPSYTGVLDAGITLYTDAVIVKFLVTTDPVCIKALSFTLSLAFPSPNIPIPDFTISICNAGVYEVISTGTASTTTLTETGITFECIDGSDYVNDGYISFYIDITPIPAAITIQNPVLCTYCSCITPVYVGNSVFVDAVFGNDLTGQRERFDLPFQTLEGASMSANGAQAGDMIFVRPGTYTPTTTVSKAGVNWYFEEGAIVNNPLTTIFNTGTYDITGYGYLNVMMTRDNGIITANYVNTLTVSTTGASQIVTIDVKLLASLGVTMGGNLQGLVNELSGVTAPLLQNSGGSVELRIDRLIYNTGASTTTGIIVNNAAGTTNLIVEKINVSALPSGLIFSDVFVSNDSSLSTLNLIFNELVIVGNISFSFIGNIFNIAGNTANIKGNLISITDLLWNNAILYVNDTLPIFATQDTTVNIDINRIYIDNGSVSNVNTTTTTATVSIRGNTHTALSIDGGPISLFV